MKGGALFSIARVKTFVLISTSLVRYIQLRQSTELDNDFIGNSTSWITKIQGAKYKIQINSN